MKGTDSKQADTLYKGIIDYYSNISGIDITSDQIKQRDAITANNGIVCDNSLDEKILVYQDQFVSAENDTATQKTIIEEVILLLNK